MNATATTTINEPDHKQAMNNIMNHNNLTSDYYFHNNVKFTGSAVEQSGDVMTVLLYFALLLMMVLNAWPN